MPGSPPSPSSAEGQPVVRIEEERPGAASGCSAGRSADVPGDAPGGAAARGALQARLAERAVERDRVRRVREARLALIDARLGAAVRRGAAEDGRDPDGAAAALESFLAALIDAAGAETPGAAAPAPLPPVPPGAEVVRFAAASRGRPPAGAEGLARLPGAGPGLVATLIRGGIGDLAALAALDAPALADRLGPVARLIDVETWLAVARAETAG